MEILDRSTIEETMIPHLSKGKRGPKSRVPFYQLVMLIVYRLKTGCQWRCLPIKEFTDGVEVKWGTVYKHFRKWSLDGSWERMWTELLKHN